MLALVQGCTTTATSPSPYKQPDDSGTASVRFRVARAIQDGGVTLYNYGDESCAPSPHGRFIDSIGVDKAFVSRTNQSIGMISPESYPKHLFVERRFIGSKPLVFSMIANAGGPGFFCHSTYKFSPVSGRLYEVAIDIVGYNNCHVRVHELIQTPSGIEYRGEATAKQLPKFCEPPTLFSW